MKNFIALALSPLVLALGLTACGGGDSSNDFQFPGVEGTSLPYTVMQKVANAEGTEIRLGGVGSAMAPHPTLPGYFYAMSDRGPNAATEATRTPSGIIFLAPSYNPHITLFRLTSSGKAEQVRACHQSFTVCT